MKYYSIFNKLIIYFVTLLLNGVFVSAAQGEPLVSVIRGGKDLNEVPLSQGLEGDQGSVIVKTGNVRVCILEKEILESKDFEEWLKVRGLESTSDLVTQLKSENISFGVLPKSLFRESLEIYVGNSDGNSNVQVPIDVSRKTTISRNGDLSYSFREMAYQFCPRGIFKSKKVHEGGNGEPGVEKVDPKLLIPLLEFSGGSPIITAKIRGQLNESKNSFVSFGKVREARCVIREKSVAILKFLKEENLWPHPSEIKGFEDLSPVQLFNKQRRLALQRLITTVSTEIKNPDYRSKLKINKNSPIKEVSIISNQFDFKSDGTSYYDLEAFGIMSSLDEQNRVVEYISGPISTKLQNLVSKVCKTQKPLRKNWKF